MPDINVSTVYRTLELLVSLDLVVETLLEGSAGYYEVSPEPSHHHFVCRECGVVEHFGDELLAPVRAELEARGVRRRRDPGDRVRRSARPVARARAPRPAPRPALSPRWSPAPRPQTRGEALNPVRVERRV